MNKTTSFFFTVFYLFFIVITIESAVKNKFQDKTNNLSLVKRNVHNYANNSETESIINNANEVKNISDNNGIENNLKSNDESLNDENYCPSINILEYFSPDDYEYGKTLIPNKSVSHINDTLAVIQRFQSVSNEWNIKFESLVKRSAPQLINILHSIDVPSECLSSILRIADGMSKREYWALKCNYFYKLLI
jgi:hypothetical protein